MNNKQLNIKPYPIQFKVLKYLFDKKHTMVFFGGSARCSKSMLLCMYSVIMCLAYNNISGAVCRNRLTHLRKTTLQTLYELFNMLNLKEDRDYKFNRNDMIMEFISTGSKLFFVELYDNPSDPDFTRIMSMSLTFACIDESSEINYKAVQMLFSRLSYKLKEYDLIPKLLIVSNPTRGWLFDHFYKKYKDNTLENYKMVILGTPLDNPSAGQSYIDHQSKVLSKLNIERYLKGNWLYDDDTYSLFSYDDLMDAFYVEPKNKTGYYISVDVASGNGSDNSCIIVWRGLEMIKVFLDNKTPTDKLIDIIKEYMTNFKVSIKNVIIDADGLGIGVANHLKGCNQFTANSRPKNNENYQNLKTQCIYKLAEYVKNHDIKFSIEHKDMIIRELQQYEIKADKDGKTQTTDKNEIKKNIGYSPDITDAILERMDYELTNKGNIYVY